MTDDYTAERIKKLKKLEEKGINPYPQIILKNKKFSEDILKSYNKLKKDSSSRKNEIIAGRIMALRNMGSIAFAHVQDEKGRLQVVFQKNKLSTNYELLDYLDLGDIIVVKGNPYRTKRGELSINASEFELASKSLLPLPEKYHGLKDEETRLRKRHLDAIMNPELIETFKKKTRIIKTVREFMDKQGFLEVQTPIMQLIYGGASAEPFKTHHNTLNTDFYLRISTEMHLKRLIIAGFEKIYEIGPTFRNEGMDSSHLQEIPNHFEFYWAYQDYEELMKFTEKLMTYLLKKINKSLKLEYQGEIFDFTTPYQRISFRELLLKNAGIDIDDCSTYESLKKEIIKKKIPDIDAEKAKHYGALLDELYKRTCRPKIKQPTFLTNYPVEMIPLAKRNESDSSKINTVQLLVNGWELVKAYDELNNPLDQRSRLLEQQEFLKKGDKEAHPLDEDFIEAIEQGMPPTAGFGLGLDRLCMFLLNQPSIRASVFFPLMKPGRED